MSRGGEEEKDMDKGKGKGGRRGKVRERRTLRDKER